MCFKPTAHFRADWPCIDFSAWPAATAGGGVAPSLLVSSRECFQPTIPHFTGEKAKAQLNVTWPRTPARRYGPGYVATVQLLQCRVRNQGTSTTSPSPWVQSLCFELRTQLSFPDSEPGLNSKMTLYLRRNQSRLNTCENKFSSKCEGHGSDSDKSFTLLEGTFQKTHQAWILELSSLSFFIFC